MNEALFTPVTLGALALRNSVVMAPMTRDRAGPGDAPTPQMVEYYRQRAGAGLIVTEGVQPSPEGKGYWRTPGIHSPKQIDGWARVAEAVHAEGGLIAMQLMHCGRVVVPANRGHEADIIAPSAVQCPDKVPGPAGVPTDCAMPRAMELDDISRVVAEFGEAAKNARAVGIDAVELHCASGYLINQFLNPASNLREDEFGQDRTLFAAMVLGCLADEIGAGRVGFRISPGNPYNGMDPTRPEETFPQLLRAAESITGLAWCHVVDMGLPELDTLAMIRANWSGPIIANNMLTAESATALLDTSRADAVSFGRAFIANPDLVARIRQGAALAKPDYSLLYTGEERGYTDYPMATPA
jgi:N-ethylmaleimide reductase